MMTSKKTAAISSTMPGRPLHRHRTACGVSEGRPDVELTGVAQPHTSRALAQLPPPPRRQHQHHQAPQADLRNRVT